MWKKVLVFLFSILLLLGSSTTILEEADISIIRHEMRTSSLGFSSLSFSQPTGENENRVGRSIYSSKAHTLAAPSFILNPKYSADLSAHVDFPKIKSAIQNVVLFYQSSISSVGRADILFDVMNTGLG